MGRSGFRVNEIYYKGGIFQGVICLLAISYLRNVKSQNIIFMIFQSGMFPLSSNQLLRNLTLDFNIVPLALITILTSREMDQ